MLGPPGNTDTSSAAFKFHFPSVHPCYVVCSEIPSAILERSSQGGWKMLPVEQGDLGEQATRLWPLLSRASSGLLSALEVWQHLVLLEMSRTTQDATPPVPLLPRVAQLTHTEGQRWGRLGASHR